METEVVKYAERDSRLPLCMDVAYLESEARKQLVKVEVEREEQKKMAMASLARLLGTETMAQWGPADNLESFVWIHNLHIWVYRCVKVKTNAFLRLEPEVWREYVSNGSTKKERVEFGHPAARIIREPNKWMTWHDLMQQYCMNRYLSGMTYVLLDDGPEELWPMRSDRVTIVPSEELFIEKYVYKIPGKQPVDLKPDFVLYGREYNPNDDWYGLSPMKAAANSINAHLRAQKYNLVFFQNAAMPLGFFFTDQRFNDQSEIDILKKELKRLYAGYENFGTFGVLGGGLKYQAINPTHTDMDFIALLDKSRDEVSAAWGVPSAFLNASEKADYANLKQWGRMLWYDAIIPESLSTQAWFSKLLTRHYAEKGERLLLVLNRSHIEELHDDALAEAEASRVLVTSFQSSPNRECEKRGEPTFDGGDEPLGPMSMVKLSQLGDVLSQRTPSIGELSQIPKAVSKSIMPDRQARIKHWMQTKATVENLEAKMIRMLTAIYSDLREQALANVRDLNVSAEEMVFDIEGAKNLLARGCEPILAASMEQGGRRALVAIDTALISRGKESLHVKVGLEGTFDMQDPRIQALLRARVQRFAKYLPEAIWKRIKDSLAEGIAAGEGADGLRKRIEAALDNEISNAATVARTEVLPSYHEGQLEGMSQSGAVDGKEWMCSFVELSREAHKAGDGQIVPLDGYFEIDNELLQYPGAAGGSPSNTINCLCDMLPVVRFEGE